MSFEFYSKKFHAEAAQTSTAQRCGWTKPTRRGA